MSLISQRVALARSGANDKVICKMASGWAVMGDVQFLPGYCLLLPDPVVSSLNDLDTQARTTYLLDMARLGDAVLQATDALRMNYEILGNSEPELHCHIFPRYASEAEQYRKMPVWFYDWKTATPYAEDVHGALRLKIARLLALTDK
ncbi:HIT family protein [Pseudomonas proteolytica]|uniref:HIT domain-containing protein n=1 Tax=Pseudomonas proteolytica TaxID=219574 RepID=A0AAW5A1R3_9PSED|nr:HIT domain-containing protein [Pseudomonas proteolytica]KAA8706119.1 HIT domain-containing protein [Pseudomonas proteolytica]MCF5058524.1 HIT domain-containing protein [Pseudomonas proteolytica]MCF5101252.1 HIT domain-containing protein [Pseudomonas proteolytica]TWR83720.1 HIT domain-containing protein [Pseudomonas proteolytica]SEE85795.1 HIT domain-containing protein [Pseudomonas proteolytica]